MTRKEGSGTDLYPVIPLFRLLLLLLLLLQLLRLLLLSWVVSLVTQETLVTAKQRRHQTPGQVARGVGQLGDGGPDVGSAKLEKIDFFQFIHIFWWSFYFGY